MTMAQDDVIGAGRVAVVTGAASGIGRALAEAFASAGSAVVVADLAGDEAEAVAAGIRAGGAEAEAVTVDVSDAAAVEQLAATTLERFGHVDVLCNNAGVSTFNLMRDQTLDDWRWVFGVNLWGVVHGDADLRADHARPGHARPHRQHRVDRRAPQRGRVHRPVLRRRRSRWCRSPRRSRQELAIDGLPIGVSVLCPSSVDTASWSRSAVARRSSASSTAPRSREAVRLAIRDSFTGPTGLTPAQVAGHVLDAIRARRFWIITHPGERPVFEARVNDILANYPSEP